MPGARSAGPPPDPPAKNRPGRRRLGETLPDTDEAKKASALLQRRLLDSLESAAQVYGHRRSASEVDVKDYQDAYDHLVNPGRRPFLIGILTDAATMLGGGLIGFAVNLATSTPTTPDRWTIGAMATGGLVIGVLCSALRHARF